VEGYQIFLLLLLLLLLDPISERIREGAIFLFFFFTPMIRL
jgi:hypothetical protein